MLIYKYNLVEYGDILMENTNTRGIRRLQAKMQDYQCYINCSYKVGYSIEIGQKSDEWDLRKNLPTYQEFLKELYFQPEDSFKQLVYEDECGRVVAYVEVMFFLERKTLEIANFIVDREYQLQGYGRKSYNELEKLARKIGIKKIFLCPVGKGARIFWEKMGFTGKKAFVKNL